MSPQPPNNTRERPELPELRLPPDLWLDSNLRGKILAQSLGGIGHREESLLFKTLSDLTGHDPEEVLVLTAPPRPYKQMNMIVLDGHLFNFDEKPLRVSLNDFSNQVKAPGLPKTAFCQNLAVAFKD